MMRTIAAALSAAFLFTSLGVTAFAAPSKMSHSAAATLKCPSCGMPMPTAKSTMMNVPIYIKAKHKVYYCCPMCPSGKKAAAYYKAHHKAMSV